MINKTTFKQSMQRDLLTKLCVPTLLSVSNQKSGLMLGQPIVYGRRHVVFLFFILVIYFFSRRHRKWALWGSTLFCTYYASIFFFFFFFFFFWFSFLLAIGYLHL